MLLGHVLPPMASSVRTNMEEEVLWMAGLLVFSGPLGLVSGIVADGPQVG